MAENKQAQQPQNQVATAPLSQNATALIGFKKDTLEGVGKRIAALQQGGLVLPNGYNPENALQSAWLYLQNIEDKNKRKAIDVCTKESIANCLLEMVTKGEDPSQKHCYFIPTGNQLSFWEDYRGRYMRAKRDTEIAKINAQVIYEGDNFVYNVNEDGEYELVKHETNLANIDLTKIIGAYAVVINKDGSRHLEVMNMKQIELAWNQGYARGNSGAHKNFTDQMCKKTVISRACKIALGSATGEDAEKAEPMNQQQAELLAAQEQRDAEQKFIEVQEIKEPEADNDNNGVTWENMNGQATAKPAQPAQAPQPNNECPI